MDPLITLHKPWYSQGKYTTRPPSGYPTNMLLNTSSTTPRRSPFFLNANLNHEGIVINLMPISTFLVYNFFEADLDAITIYRRINTLDNLSKTAIQALLTFLRGCMTSILVNDMGTFIPSSVFMESPPPEARTWGLNKLNIIFPTLCSSHQEPGPASTPPAASSDINLNLFQNFLSNFKLPGLSPSHAISGSSTEPTMEDIYSM